MVALVTLSTTPAWAQLTAPGADRLLADTRGAASIKVNETTGLARFVEVGASLSKIDVDAPAPTKAEQFLDAYGDAFGITSSGAQLVLDEVAAAPSGGVRVSYHQVHGGVPVFGARLFVHLDRDGAIRRVNGSTLADLQAPTSPKLEQDAAIERAEAMVRQLHGKRSTPALFPLSAELVVYQDGVLTKRLEQDHLAWVVDVTNGADIRRLVIVDAIDGHIVDSFNQMHDAMHRIVYDGQTGGYDANNPLANVIWEEGDPNTGIAGADDLHTFAEDAYDFFNNAFGRDSYDGNGSVMRSVHNLPDPSLCPNAFWNGLATHYCDGVTPDDVVAHEWGHAYTEYTHGLIYAYEPGALNEAYSDIFGEAVDLINADGHPGPKTPRAPGGCGAGLAPPSIVSVDGFGDISGIATGYGPDLSDVGPVAGRAATVLDDTFVVDDGCEPLTNAANLNGAIAVINASDFFCYPSNGLLAADAAGAVGVLIVVPDGVGPFNLGPGADTSSIPSLLIPASVGLPLISFLDGNAADTVLTAPSVAEELSTRWQMGEGATAFGGAIRDMYNPSCHGHPATTADPNFYCGEFDGGGVHLNSGVPNHAFALLVDGGTTAGVAVPAIGLIKAVHIYYVAMTQYQTPTSGFADHADALTASCNDLLTAGTNLLDPLDGQPSGEIIDAADCAAVSAALQATGMRNSNPCNYGQLMDLDTPPLTCPTGGTLAEVFADDFETDPSGTWTLQNISGLDILNGPGSGAASGYLPIDFVWTSDLPDGRPGSAFLGENASLGNCADVNQSSVMRLTSPIISLDEDKVDPVLSFTHWFSIEPDWDGGNLAIRVNGGGWYVIGSSNFQFNPYTSVLNGNTDNPLNGQPAFSGFEAGTLQGVWAESQVDLSGYAGPGDDIQIRFQLGVDGCFGYVGWFVDDVAIHGCAAVCGDGALFGSESCDDGNTTDDGNGCSEACERDDVCGDGAVQSLFETCDDGAPGDQGNGCSETCQRNDVCGDGVHQSLYEPCDDGNEDNTDDCLVGCVLPACGDGYVQVGVEDCDPGNTNDDGDGCSATCTNNAVCGDDVVQSAFETCDDGSPGDQGNGCSETCQRNDVCGDGATQALYETCDDGDATDDGNGCSDSCQRNDVCGDGAIQSLFETCDDGDASDDGNGCSDTCQRNDVCGDGAIQSLYEACDDGNTQSGDGCTCDAVEPGWTCPTAGAPCLPICGDGVVLGGEVCDDGNTNDDDGCNSTCSSDESCGNGITDSGEACDDGDALDNGEGGCVSDCSAVQTCGDGAVDGTEVCDDGNTQSGDGCSASCDRLESCGNGVLDSGEVCDDGNTQSGDGCSATCDSDESCGNGVLDDGEACDDGNTDGGDGCNSTCSSDESCGNGVLDDGEACDDGNIDSGDGCSAACSSDESCGNGIIDEGEDCDDGNDVDDDDCSSACLAVEDPVGGCSATHPSGDGWPVGGGAIVALGLIGARRRRRR